MRFAAIDVGTNSIHLIVVEIDADLDTSRVLYKAREMVRLGAGDAMERGLLGPKAMDRGAAAIARFAEAAREQGAVAVRAVATSAVREAANAVEFTALVRERAGVDLEILSGHEEARLIHLGVARGYPIYDRLACIIDIGGGSTEFIVADGYRPYFLESVKLGSLRLYDAYMRGAASQVVAAYRLDQHIATQLEPLLERLREFPLDIVIGTSGTIMGLAALDAAGDEVTARVHGYELRLERLRALQTRMLAMSENERRRMPGMNPRRADIIVAGNAVMIAALEGLGRDRLVVCERALRDGVVVDFVQRDQELMRSLGDERARRLDAVENLGRRFASAGAHERHVAATAVALFDRLLDLHGMGQADRDLLNAAALVHDIGRYVNPSAHHKHGAYLIRNALLPGWRARRDPGARGDRAVSSQGPAQAGPSRDGAPRSDGTCAGLRTRGDLTDRRRPRCTPAGARTRSRSRSGTGAISRSSYRPTKTSSANSRRRSSKRTSSKTSSRCA